MSKFRELAAAVVTALPDDLPDDLIGQWCSHPVALAAAIRAALASSADLPVYSVTINYGRSVEALLFRDGRYDYVNSEITNSNFPTSAVGSQNLYVDVMAFNRRINSEEVVEELDRLGFRPATIHELLTFGAQYPDFQDDYNLVALGSPFQDRGGELRAPYLNRIGSARYFCCSLVKWSGDWTLDWQFAAVRK